MCVCVPLRASLSLFLCPFCLLSECKWYAEATKQKKSVSLNDRIQQRSSATTEMFRFIVVSSGLTHLNSCNLCLLYVLSISPFETSPVNSYSVSVLVWGIHKFYLFTSTWYTLLFLSFLNNFILWISGFSGFFAGIPLFPKY